MAGGVISAAAIKAMGAHIPMLQRVAAVSCDESCLFWKCFPLRFPIGKKGIGGQMQFVQRNQNKTDSDQTDSDSLLSEAKKQKLEEQGPHLLTVSICSPQ